jgi:hypothetical protein
MTNAKCAILNVTDSFVIEKKIIVQSYFFFYASLSEKFQFSNRYNFCTEEFFRVKSIKMSILSEFYYC